MARVSSFLFHSQKNTMQYPFFSAPLSTLLAGVVLSVAATGAMAQAPAPSTVGVTPQDASEAMRKAVPRTDTGTVVRTDESASSQARSAAKTVRAKSSAKPAATVHKTPRPPRADRS